MSDFIGNEVFANFNEIKFRTMENFDWTTLKKGIAVSAELQSIYNAWTKPIELEKWFLSKANYFRGDEPISKTDNILNGDTYEWYWHLYDGVEIGKVTETNGKDHVQFTFAGDCIVDVILEKLENQILVKLTQKNIPTDDKSKQDIRLGCADGWAFFLVNLKSVYQGGLDLRNKDAAVRGVLNG